MASIKKDLRGYICDDREKNWSKEYATREISLHKKNLLLDHPDGSVTTSKLADGSVTEEKLDEEVISSIAENRAEIEIVHSSLLAEITARKSEDNKKADKINTYTKSEVDNELERLQYYGDKDIIPSDLSYFDFSINDTTMTASVNVKTDYLLDGILIDKELVIPYKYAYNEKEYIVTALKANGIANYNYITKVIIPNSVTIIGSQAFMNCTSLMSITIPDSVRDINTGAFMNCTSLMNITIPEGITKITSNTFKKCTGLGTITIPDTVTSIDSEAFCECSALRSITIPDSVTDMGKEAFKKCDGLIDINISRRIKELDLSMISGCYSLTDIIIPEGVEKITSGTVVPFNHSLTSVMIPSSVTSISARAFGKIPDSFIIKGYKNTKAEEYAKNNGINFISIGIDVDQTYNSESENAQSGKAVSEAISIKADKTANIIFSNGETLVLNNNQQAHCNTPITELVLSVGDIIDDVYTSNFSFTTGDSISLTYPATPIFWMGDDCDSEGSFTPEPNTGYEISIKRIGDRPMSIDAFIPNLVATVKLYNGYYYQDNEDAYLLDSAGMYLRDYRIYGNSYQTDEPQIDLPVEIRSVGDLVKDKNDVNFGKYKIPIKVSTKGNSTNINIYLDEPLRKVGDYEEYADYIDFRNKKVVRNIGVKIFDGSESQAGTVFNDYVFGTVIKLDNSAQRGDVIRKGLCNFLPQDNTNPQRSSFAFHHAQSHPYVYLCFKKTDFPQYEGVTAETAGSSAMSVIKDFYDSYPLELYYQLQTPTEELIELPEIPTYMGETVIDVDTDVRPGAVKYQYYKRSEMI